MRTLLPAFLLVVVAATTAIGQTTQPAERADLDRRIGAVLPRVVGWRRDIHEHPESRRGTARVSPWNPSSAIP